MNSTQKATREELIAMLRTVSNAVQMPKANTMNTSAANFTTGEQDSSGYDLIRMRMVVIEHVRELLANEDCHAAQPIVRRCECMTEPDEHGDEHVAVHSSDCPEYLGY